MAQPDSLNFTLIPEELSPSIFYHAHHAQLPLRFLVELESHASRALYATPPTRLIKLHANH
jgi:hypothetical protein